MSDDSGDSASLKLETLVNETQPPSEYDTGVTKDEVLQTCGSCARTSVSTDNETYLAADGGGPSSLQAETDNSVQRLSVTTPATLPSVRDGNGSDSSTWISRVQRKTEELRKFFNLPEGENLRQDYVCALKKRLLLQGRLYVFEHYVCFYSNILGYVKTKVIPLESVVNIKKRRNVGFPNSIEIVWKGGLKEFFTSFLSRDEAYRNLLLAWSDTSPLARLVNEAVQSTVSSPPKAKKGIIASAATAAAVAVQSTTAHMKEGGSALTKTLRTQASRHFRSHTFDSSQLHFSTKESVEKESASDIGDAYGEDNDNDTASLDNLKSGGTTVEERDNSDDESEAVNEGDEFEMLDHDPPALPSDYSKIAAVDLPMSVKDMLNVLISSKSDFFERFHSSRGDKNVSMTSWGKHPRMGCVRQLQFVSPLKYRIGPPEARCHQTQRYGVYKGEYLVFETSQVIPEIPYGDNFSVECRWDVTPTSPTSVHVDVSIHVPFSKPTIWRKAIEKGVVENTKDAFKDMFEQLKNDARTTSTVRPPTGSSTSEVPAAVAGGSGSKSAVPSSTSSSQPAAAASRTTATQQQQPASASTPEVTRPALEHRNSTGNTASKDWEQAKEPFSSIRQLMPIFIVLWAVVMLVVQLLILRQLGSISSWHVEGSSEATLNLVTHMKQEILELRSHVTRLQQLMTADMAPQ